jgi:hypothetical protein
MQTMPVGRNVWGFSNDDSHSLNATGYSWNTVLLPANNLREVRNAMEGGAFYSVSRVSRLDGINRYFPASSGGNEIPGSGTAATLYLLEQPTPGISNIVVNQTSGAISVTGTNYNLIEWIADGEVIATGNTINIRNHQDKINSYVRAQLKSSTGIAFTQPFGIEEVTFTPHYPTDRSVVANETGISLNNLVAKNSGVFLHSNAAASIARRLLNADLINMSIFPVFSGTVSKSGHIAAMSFMLSGEELQAKYPKDINLIGLTSGSTGRLFGYVRNESDFSDGMFTVLKNGGILEYESGIEPGEKYELVMFIKDGGEYDLDHLVNGRIIVSAFIASHKSATGVIDEIREQAGCSLGYEYLAFGLLVIPFILRNKKY